MLKLENEKLTQQRIKAIHLKQIYLLALKKGTISRQQVRQALRLSPPSSSALVDELLERGVLAENGLSEASGRGRPSIALQIRSSHFVIPVISLTADGFDAFLFDVRTNLLEQTHLFLDFSQSVHSDGVTRLPPEVFSAPLLQWLDAVKRRWTPLILLLSLSGSIADGYFSSSAFQFYVPDRFVSILEKEGRLPVLVGNTASYFAYGEKQYHPDDPDFIYLFIDDGVGAGILHNGLIFGDGLMWAGEIGHISIDCQGRPCICGGRGCLEQYVSIPAIVRDAGMSFSQVCDSFQAGEENAVALITEKAVQLAVGINNALTMHPTEHIIIGGKITDLGDSFLSILAQQIRTVGMRRRMDHVSVEFAANNHHGDVFGALWNYIEHTLEIDDITE